MYAANLRHWFYIHKLFWQTNQLVYKQLLRHKLHLIGCGKLLANRYVGTHRNPVGWDGCGTLRGLSRLRSFRRNDIIGDVCLCGLCVFSAVSAFWLFLTNWTNPALWILQIINAEDAEVSKWSNLLRCKRRDNLYCGHSICHNSALKHHYITNCYYIDW